MKKNYFIIVLLIIILFGCTKKNIESPNTTTSEDSISTYLTKANDFSSSTTKRKEYTEKAFEIIMNQDNDSLHRANLFKVANRYYNLNNLDSYRKTVLIVLEKAEKAKDTTSKAKAYSYLGDFYSSQGVSDTAFSFYKKAEKLYIIKKDNYKLARTRLNKALLQYNESDYSGSQISALNAFKVLKGVKETNIIYEIHDLLGLLYNELGEYNKAIEYHNKALDIINKESTPIEFQSKATSMNNLGLVYQNLNQDEKAIQYFQKGLAYKKDLLLYKPYVYALLLDNLGYSRFKLNQSKDLPELFYESLELRKKLNLTIGVIASNVRLSEYFASKNDTSKSIYYSKEALDVARKSKNDRNLLLPLKQLAVIIPKNAFAYNKEYIHINDSIQKTDRNIADKFTRIEYETDQIKEENSALTEQNRNLVYIFGSILILGMFMYIIKAQKVKNRELLYKQEQQKVNEEIYNLMISQQNNVESIRVKEKKRVAQELHDGVLGRMFGVRMNLDGLNNFNDENASKQRINYLNELKKIEQDIREISHDLNREKSELINNFVAIVEILFEEQKKTFSPKLTSNIDSNIQWESMNNSNKINLYRILQESFQNINKYANAKSIKVEFKKNSNHLLLQISDDGIGFNVNKGKKGIGLQNMLSRINECKGTFEIASKKGEGTTITVTVPI